MLLSKSCSVDKSIEDMVFQVPDAEDIKTVEIQKYAAITVSRQRCVNWDINIVL